MARQRGGRPPRKRGSRRGSGGSGGSGRPQAKKAGATYYMQPGRRGTVVVLHRAVGNRVSPKVCGVMPSRVHAVELVKQLQRAESALHDLFYEATDDGIETLEAVLHACRQAVLTRMPPDDGTMGLEEMRSERDRIQSELDARGTQQRVAAS